MVRNWTITALCVGFLVGSGAKAAAPTPPVENYPVHPDAVRQPGVPQGKVTQGKFADSKIFPNTERDYWIYVPAQYDAKSPACLMVCQDGSGFADEKRDFKLPIVFDNLIHKKEMPVTIALMINPGNDPKKNPPPKPGEKRKTPFKPNNRSFEYDTLSDQYVRFLLEEMIPLVTKDYKLTDNPEGWAICGNSSGGICAFTAAWERPDKFRKVISHVGSFTAIAYRPAEEGKPMRPGGDLYPGLIRRVPPKPIRIHLQDGRNDLDNQFGNWPLANMQMEKAFLYANRTADEAKKDGPRYDVKFVLGEGAHNGKHGAAIFPDTLRWIWRDYPGVVGAK